MSQSSKVLKEFGGVNIQYAPVEQFSGSGALGEIGFSSELTTVKTTGAATGTIANGAPGQKKTIVLTAYGGNYVLTPANFGNGTTVTFGAAGDSIQLVWASGKWWSVATTATIA